MMEIFSFITGGLFRLAPEIMKVWDRANERKHELEMLGRQVEADKARSDARFQLAELEGKVHLSVAELQAMMTAHQQQAAPIARTGIRWIDGINGLMEGLSKSVRPVLTYWYCVAAYGAYKLVLYRQMIAQDFAWDEAVLQLWTPQDHQVMWSIIGFWFVDRALKHMGR